MFSMVSSFHIGNNPLLSEQCAGATRLVSMRTIRGAGSKLATGIYTGGGSAKPAGACGLM
ncbi:MAG: hypothetical protein VXZ82_11180 [Planctomycetota bacterium]|nr:hypothetical protein [Planctomycetota bacterium]